MVVNLDPHHRQSGWVDLDARGPRDPGRPPYQVHDLLGDGRYLWPGARNYVELDPHVMPAHIFRVRRTSHRAGLRLLPVGRHGRRAPKRPGLEDDPLWYKDAVIYQLHVRAFHDSDGDGIGDFRGLTEKLDYLQDLGVTALWLLPFYPSPLRDDGYDIADYVGSTPTTARSRDFQRFLREAHRRGLRVITELVLNHTSDQHPWFQRARRAGPGSRVRATSTCGATPRALPGRPDHLPGLRDLELVAGTRWPRPTTGTASTTTSPT